MNDNYKKMFETIAPIQVYCAINQTLVTVVTYVTVVYTTIGITTIVANYIVGTFSE